LAAHALSPLAFVYPHGHGFEAKSATTSATGQPVFTPQVVGTPFQINIDVMNVPKAGYRPQPTVARVSNPSPRSLSKRTKRKGYG
jgi:hypothetical protein